VATNIFALRKVLNDNDFRSPICISASATRSPNETSAPAHPALKEGIAHCEAVGDYISRELLESILESEEEHIDFLETQLELMKKVGLQNWLQT